MPPVLCFRSDQEQRAQAWHSGNSLLDLLAGLELRIDFSAIADSRHIGDVLGIIQGIVDMKRTKLMLGCCGRQFGVRASLDKSSACFEGCPFVGMLQADVPRPGSAH